MTILFCTQAGRNPSTAALEQMLTRNNDEQQMLEAVQDVFLAQ